MKKICFLLLMIVNTSINAQELTASLQQGTSMIPFYGENALVQAYEAAESSGAVITLSAGLFNTMDNISKSITLVGTYGFGDQAERTVLSSVTITANHVKIEGIQFDGTLSLGAVTDFYLKRCYVNTFTSTDQHIRTIVDQCRVTSESAVANSEDYCVKNSVISFNSKNTSHALAFFTNCSLSVGNAWPFGVYRNCLIRLSSTSSSLTSPSEYYNNVFTNESSPNSVVSLSYGAGCQRRGNTSLSYSSIGAGADPFRPSNMPLGEDNTVVGPMGGMGFSPYPSIPRILRQNIDESTDGAGNLNVELEVQAEP